jgi:leucyl/phenylalanyl-tRNA--protein transferase
MSQRTLTPDILLRAYRSGVFPMAESRHRPRLYWVDPEWRGIVPLEKFHVPRRLRKTVRRGPYAIRVDAAFVATIEACAEPRAGSRDTWITDEIVRAYAELNALGFAHSVEAWLDDKLVGGLYGVSIGGAFFGESMFSRATDASKVALVHLVARLVAGGYRLLDSQFITEHLQQFGTVEVSRAEYRRRLAEAVQAPAAFPREFSAEALDAYLQSTTQTS